MLTAATAAIGIADLEDRFAFDVPDRLPEIQGSLPI